MSKADKIENAMLKIIGIGVGIMAIHAARKAAYRKGTEDYYKDKHNKYDRLNDDDLTIAIKEDKLANTIKDGSLNKSVKGIGAVKRRIYKEISLAQDAGIDFAKTFADMTEDEINLLEELGHNAGWEQKEQKPYAEAYYTSLRKAYNAISGISGIGNTYKIKDNDGNVILTWIEDAKAHVAHEREIQDKRNRALELEEQSRAARKRMKATQRAIDRDGMLPGKQMSLFGMGYAPEVENELWEIWREQLEYGDTDYDYDTWRRIYGDDYVQYV